jgi:3-hydroxybutyryl-CoA dehydrogenase
MTGPGLGTVAVLGVGTVGAALVSRLARAGVRVIAIEADHGRAASARQRVEDAGGSTEAVTYTSAIADAAPADLVVEALPERRPEKVEALREAAAVCRPDAVFATTTTAFPVGGIGVACDRLDRLVGLHLVEPGTVADLVEVVATPVVDPAVLDDVTALAERAGLTTVRVTDRSGPLSGALLMRYLNGAVSLLEQRYATRDDIDAAMRLGCGLRIGPLAQLDLIGLDVARDTLQALYERTGRRCFVPAPLLATTVEAGMLGRKSGRGFYTYPEGPADPVASPVPAGGAAPGRVAIVGSGTVARGAAEACARAGIPVVLLSRSEAGARQAGEAIERSLESAVRRGRLTAERAAAALALLEVEAGLDRVGQADLVLEAVPEDLAVKRAVFADLDKLARPGAVLATGTSGLPVVACARATGRPEDVLGIHFFHPVPAMRLAEVVRTPYTSDRTVAVAGDLCAVLGKRAVHCADRAGFVVNALLLPYLNEAVGLLEQTYAADDIDTVMRDGCGFPMGPLELLDMIGIDICLAVQNRLFEAFQEPDLQPVGLLEDLVRVGYLGRKSQRGFRAR